MSAITPFEKDIEKRLQDLSADITMSPQLESRIKFALRKERGKKGVVPMKHRTLKRTLAIAAVLSLTTVTVFAGSLLLGRSSRGSSIPDFKTIPTEEQLAEHLSYTPKILPEFSNGLTFKGAHIIENTEGEEEFTSMDLRYEKKGLEISVSTEAAGRLTPDDRWEKIMQEEIPLYYTSYRYKAVPADYEPTEKEVKDQEAGILGIGYGASEIEESLIQEVMWNQDGVTYLLMLMDESEGNALTREDFIQMAREYVNYK